MTERKVKPRRRRRCVQCNKLVFICGFDMCKKCWSYDYVRIPEVKERRELYNQLPDQKEKRSQYQKRRQQSPEVKEYDKLKQRRLRATPVIIRSACGLEKKRYQNGLCRQCCDYQRYSGKEKYNEIKRVEASKYRSTPQGKATVKAYNAANQERKNEWRREAREDPKYAAKELDQARRWRESQPEEWWIGRRREFREWWFFHVGKPIGPFDPNEILDKRLLKALEEVRNGNLKPPKRDNAPGPQMSE